MAQDEGKPARVREVFGENLRKLIGPKTSVSQVCRDLGINRTQFNRYLSSESFPRPDVLQKICVHFDVDARILLQSLPEIQTNDAAATKMLAIADMLQEYKSIFVSEEQLPSGHYLLYRNCFFDPSKIATTLLRVERTEHGFVQFDGYMPRKGASRLGLGVRGKQRRMRGNAFTLTNGFAFLMSLTTVPTWHFGMMSRYYLGNPALFNGMSVSAHNPVRAYSVLLEKMPSQLGEILAMRTRLTSVPMSEAPHYVRSYFRFNQTN